MSEHGKFMGLPPEDRSVGMQCEERAATGRKCNRVAVVVCTVHDYSDNDVWCGWALCRKHYDMARAASTPGEPRG